ncbi:hypothetical protein BDN70DRAFT_880306 [Pholiota conissans]|uniref:Uncharacterized protein n=1 Tax=Pholiota conissans TaxID=109636 RepID=A0A9P5YYM2_9AGAR|nr:hypothetical protein BDN70DRAFT_880306 [Pholiota conissans]
MDDDITFGASVWGAGDPIESTSNFKVPPPVSQPSKFDDHSAYDDFDAFGTPEEATKGDLKDDDFGDFGEAEAGSSMSFGETELFNEETRIPGPSSQNWRPLLLDPFPSRSSLESELDETLAPIWQRENIANITTDEPIREAEGIAQILVTSGSREMYKMLLQTPPPTKPPNWTRSRIRRQHLIALGIPVNLDEVLPRANVKPLPTLEIHTRPMSAPPGGRNQNLNGNNAGGSNTRQNSRTGTPQPGQQGVYGHLGPKPELDTNKINKLLQLSHESLTMQPLASLERYLAEIKMQTANTSNLLTHLLQARDALQQDSETYNGLIAEMVGEAQKLKSGKTRMGSIRRGSGMA